jgi:hypothetical protein
LRQSASWSFFLAIMGFIGIAFMLIFAFVINSAMSKAGDVMPGGMGGMGGVISGMTGMLTWFYVILAVIYFFPVYYLFKYATDMKQALLSENSDMLTNAFGYLKAHHKFLGISLIVIIVLYIIGIIGMVAYFASMTH